MSENPDPATTDRTEFEKDEVLNAPWAWELATFAKFVSDNIKKAPPPARAAAIVAADAAIAAVVASLDAIVAAMPSISPDYEEAKLMASVKAWMAVVAAIPADAPLKALEPVEQYIETTELLPGAPDSDAPVVPNYLTDTLIEDQAKATIKYIDEHSIG